VNLRIAFAAVLTAGVIGSSTWLVFFSPVLGVREVEIVGNLTLTEEEVREAAQVSARTPLAAVDVADVRRRVLLLPLVESAEVDRGWPTTLRIAIVEREPIAVVPVGGKSALVDRHAVVTEVRSVPPPRLPVLRVDRFAADDLASRAALAVVDALPDDLLLRVDEVRARSAASVTLRLSDGRTIMWGGADRAEQKVRVIDELLRRKADVYDVSSPDVVMIR
jgi:cell division protein FtsQ